MGMEGGEAAAELVGEEPEAFKRRRLDADPPRVARDEHRRVEAAVVVEREGGAPPGVHRLGGGRLGREEVLEEL